MTDEWPVQPVDGIYCREDAGGVRIFMTRRKLTGAKQDPANPGVMQMTETPAVVFEAWMTHPMAALFRKTLNDILSKKPLPEPKKAESPEIG